LHAFQSLELSHFKAWCKSYKAQEARLNELHTAHLKKHYDQEMKQARSKERGAKVADARARYLLNCSQNFQSFPLLSFPN
jgi:hypothetical protein